MAATRFITILGNCKFEDVTEKAGVAVGGLSTGAAWGDYDRDGHVDLFVSRYVHVDMDKLAGFWQQRKDFAAFGESWCSADLGVIAGESDFLFHNRGDGTFEDVSKKAGVDDPKHYYGLGVVWGDYDNDGWPDLYVANDAGPNYLYRNKHDGTFEEVGLMLGADLSGDGQELGSMGVDMGDYDHEGRLDIFVSEFVDQSDTLYHNNGDDGFADVSVAYENRPTQSSLRGVGHRLFRHGQFGLARYLRGERACVSAGGHDSECCSLQAADAAVSQQA